MAKRKELAVVFLISILMSACTLLVPPSDQVSQIEPQTNLPEPAAPSHQASEMIQAPEIIRATFDFERENRFQGLTNVLWFADKVLFFFFIIFGIGIVCLSFRKQIQATKRERLLLKFKNELVKTALPTFAPKIKPEEFTRMIKNWGVKNPEEMERKFRDYLVSSGRSEEIERIARSNKNKWRRIDAIAFIHYLRPATALDVLNKTLYDRDRDISYFSMLALGRIKNRDSARMLLNFLTQHVFNGQKILSLLEDFPPDIIDEIVDISESHDSIVRFWAIKLLAKFKPPNQLQKIVAFTDDSSPNVRSAACECLGELGRKEAKGAILKRLDDKVWFVRMQAVRALFKIFGPKSIPDLVQLMMKDDSTFVKDSIKNAIVSDIEQALPYIQLCLNSKDSESRRYCIDALVDSNYVPQVLADVISADSESKKKATKLLASMIQSGVYFGLKKILDDFVPASRMRILSVISSMDKNLALRIQSEGKMKHVG